MNQPSPDEIQVALRVLRKLRQRIHRSAERTAANLPKNAFGGRHAAQIEEQACTTYHCRFGTDPTELLVPQMSAESPDGGGVMTHWFPRRHALPPSNVKLCK